MLEWKGSRALIDPFPPPPIKKFPAPDMAMSANKITTTMNWAVAPSAISGNRTGPVWFLYGDEVSSIGRYNKSINQFLFSFVLPAVVFTLLGFALLLYCSGFARRNVGCVVAVLDSASTPGASVTKALHVSLLPPHLRHRTSEILASRKKSLHYSHFGRRFDICRQSHPRTVDLCAQSRVRKTQARRARILLGRSERQRHTLTAGIWTYSPVVRHVKDLFGRRSVLFPVLALVALVLLTADYHGLRYGPQMGDAALRMIHQTYGCVRRCATLVSDFVVCGKVVVATLTKRSFDRVLDFKDAFFFGCWDALQTGFNSIEKVNDLQDEVRSLEKRLETKEAEWKTKEAEWKTKEAEWKVKENNWSDRIDTVAARLLQAHRDLKKANGVASILRWQIVTSNTKGSPNSLVIRNGPDGCSNPGVRFDGQCAEMTRRMPFSTSGCSAVRGCPQDQLRAFQLKDQALRFGPTTEGIKSAKIATDLYPLRQRLLHRSGADDPSTRPVSDLDTQMKLDDSDECKTKFGEQVNNIHEEHRRNVEELKRTHRVQVENIKALHRKEVNGLKAAHKERISQLNAESASTTQECAEKERVLKMTVHGLAEGIKAEEVESLKLRREHSRLGKEHEGCEPHLKQGLKVAEMDESSLRRRAEGAEQRVLELTQQIGTLRAQATESSEVLKELREELDGAQAERKAHTVKSAKAENRARAAFFKSFRNGFDILPTDSKDFLCGFYAVIESIKARNDDEQNHQLPVPSTADLLHAISLRQQSMREFHRESGLSEADADDAAQRNNYFSAEEIFIALDQWATDKNLRFQLGYIRRFGSCRIDGSDDDYPDPGYEAPVLLSGPHDYDPGRIVIWIHYTGGFDNDPTAHWSGMRQHVPLKVGGD
ncbi:MAG: hypothetical protein Q9204_004173 [Flavoplaca sp. TL-2023a]